MAAPVEETAQVKTRGEGLWHPTAWEAQWGRRERPGLAGDAGSAQPSVAFSLDGQPTPLFCSASRHPPSCHPRHCLIAFRSSGSGVLSWQSVPESRILPPSLPSFLSLTTKFNSYLLSSFSVSRVGEFSSLFETLKEKSSLKPKMVPLG